MVWLLAALSPNNTTPILLVFSPNVVDIGFVAIVILGIFSETDTVITVLALTDPLACDSFLIPISFGLTFVGLANAAAFYAKTWGNIPVVWKPFFAPKLSFLVAFLQTH